MSLPQPQPQPPQGGIRKAATPPQAADAASAPDAAAVPEPLAATGTSEAEERLWRQADDADRRWLLSELDSLELIALRRAAFCQMLVLLEAAMGWVSGSAWTDALVFWSPLGDQPTWDVIFKDFGRFGVCDGRRNKHICLIFTML